MLVQESEVAQRFGLGLFDHILGDQEQVTSSGRSADGSPEQLKDAIARDLEALLNSRAALPEQTFESFPECGNSIINYGLLDFAGMTLSSSTDQARICKAVKHAIERHEPRLRSVSVALRVHRSPVNRIDFVISAALHPTLQGGRVQFDAVLVPSSQQYSIR